MFFTKEEKTTVTKPEKIAIIGDSPLAFFLQAYFLNTGYECKLFISENQANLYRKLGPVTVRTPFMQHFRYKPEIITASAQQFDFYFLASSAESCRSDIFFLPNSGSNHHIINLSGFYNHRFISQLTTPEIINGFTNTHITLNTNKNTLDVFDKDLTFFLSAPNDITFYINKLFSSPSFTVTAIKNLSMALWQNLCIYFIAELLLATHNRKIPDSTQSAQSHTQISGVINELKSIIMQQNNIQINDGEILSGIYTTPDDYHGATFQKSGFLNFSNIFSGINASNAPKTYNLLMQMSKKYMA